MFCKVGLLFTTLALTKQYPADADGQNFIR